MLRYLRQHTIEEWLAVLMMGIMIVLLTWQIFLRFVFNESLSWLEETSRFFFVWSVYFGFVIAAEKDRHIRVAIHIAAMPPFWQNMFLTVADLCWLVFNAIVIWQGILFTSSMFEFPYISQTTGINLVWVQMIVPIGFSFMTVRIIQCMIRRWRKAGPAIGDSRLDT